MTEQEPKGLSPEQRKFAKDISKLMRHNELAHLAGNIFYLLGTIYVLSATEEGRKVLKMPEFRELLMSREKRTGLLEDTILAPTLYHPNEDHTSLQKTGAEAGRWVCYDFRRPQEFLSKKVKQTDKGKIFAFPLPSVINNSPETYTPTKLLNVFDLADLMSLENPTIQELMDYGFMKEKTYPEAFESAGELQKYGKAIALNKLNNEKVYQITPKGNALVFLATDSGKPIEQKSKLKELVPQLNFPF